MLQLKLLQASVYSQELERKRIAADLHDEIGSLLSSLGSNMNYLKTIDSIPKEEKAFIEQAVKLIDNGLSNVRRISYDLLPPTLVKFGLYEALQELIGEVNHLSHIRIFANFEPLKNNSFPDHIGLAVFRVFKELIANSLKEEMVSEIFIQCHLTHELTFEYSDNGNGFSDTQQTQGLGIFTMRSRIQSVYGTIQFSTATDNFFAAIIKIPLNTKKT
ncbi:histidine kinase [Fluviicola taffensis]|uniref:sensor histidine kinase n=1 Tax=Fluviicola taffensis TaxID=191579 RepID=UPI003137F125